MPLGRFKVRFNVQSSRCGRAAARAALNLALESLPGIAMIRNKIAGWVGAAISTIDEFIDQGKNRRE
jgi:hypothetical protein